MRRYTKRIICASCVGLLTSFTPSLASESSEETPDSITLTGVVRDFNERTEPGGHTDFEQRPDHGFGHYCKNIDEQLGVDGNVTLVINDWGSALGFHCRRNQGPEWLGPAAATGRHRC